MVLWKFERRTEDGFVPPCYLEPIKVDTPPKAWKEPMQESKELEKLFEIPFHPLLPHRGVGLLQPAQNRF